MSQLHCNRVRDRGAITIDGLLPNAHWLSDEYAAEWGGKVETYRICDVPRDLGNARMVYAGPDSLRAAIHGRRGRRVAFDPGYILAQKIAAIQLLRTRWPGQELSLGVSLMNDIRAVCCELGEPFIFGDGSSSGSTTALAEMDTTPQNADA